MPFYPEIPVGRNAFPLLVEGSPKGLHEYLSFLILFFSRFQGRRGVRRFVFFSFHFNFPLGVLALRQFLPYRNLIFSGHLE